jgi:putative membrane protein
MMYGYGNGMSGWGYVLMIAAMLVVLALVTGGVLVLIRSVTAARRPAADLIHRQEAERILEQRFARGEVDQDEFRSRINALRSNGRP